VQPHGPGVIGISWISSGSWNFRTTAASIVPCMALPVLSHCLLSECQPGAKAIHVPGAGERSATTASRGAAFATRRISSGGGLTGRRGPTSTTSSRRWCPSSSRRSSLGRRPGSHPLAATLVWAGHPVPVGHLLLPSLHRTPRHADRVLLVPVLVEAVVERFPEDVLRPLGKPALDRPGQVRVGRKWPVFHSEELSRPARILFPPAPGGGIAGTLTMRRGARWCRGPRAVPPGQRMVKGSANRPRISWAGPDDAAPSSSRTATCPGTDRG
jgi:hypothetical protein